MNQIMRLRRIAGNDYGIEDRNNGYRHEHAFVQPSSDNGLLHEADLLPDSYGGKFQFPRAVPELVGSLPAISKALLRRKVTPEGAAARAQGAQGTASRRSTRDRGARRALRAEPLHHRLRRGHREGGAPAGRPRRGRPTRRAGDPRRTRDEGRLLARLRQPRLHPGAPRLDGAGRAAAGHRARRARPRELLRRRRHRRAQPGARRHAQRAHLRARPAGRRAPS